MCHLSNRDSIESAVEKRPKLDKDSLASGVLHTSSADERASVE
jgi:hypothetical protein